MMYGLDGVVDREFSQQLSNGLIGVGANADDLVDFKKIELFSLKRRMSEYGRFFPTACWSRGGWGYEMDVVGNGGGDRGMWWGWSGYSFNEVGNYLKIGLYRDKRAVEINSVFVDDLFVGDC
jgi:hypothetical protein